MTLVININLNSNNNYHSKSNYYKKDFHKSGDKYQQHTQTKYKQNQSNNNKYKPNSDYTNNINTYKNNSKPKASIQFAKAAGHILAASNAMRSKKI